MKLFYTPTSPYARITRVAVLELGLGDAVEMRPVTVRDPSSPLLAHNPTGKVPTLTTDEGFVLSESRLICEHLDRLHDGPRWISDASDLAARELEGIVAGFLEGVLAWVREVRRPAAERSRALIELERERAGRCLDHFEARPGCLAPEPRYATVALACALASADLRLSLPWREGRTALARWHREIESRPSMRATTPVAE